MDYSDLGTLFVEHIHSLHYMLLRNLGVRERRNRPRRINSVSGGIAQLFLNLGCVVSITPRPSLPPRKTRYPLYRRLGCPRSRSG